MSNDLLTVKQFAEATGLTQQAIYKQLNKRLNNYVVIVDGQKMLKRSALKNFSNSTVKQQDNNSFNTLLEQNQQIIDMLKKELEEKNKQIAELQKIVDQQQKLTGIAQAKILELEEKSQDPEQEQEQSKKWFQFWRK